MSEVSRAVKSAILDNKELARVVERKGYRVGYHLAPEMMRVRMFKSNLSRILGTDEECHCHYFQPSMDVSTCDRNSGAILLGTYCGCVRRALDE